MASADGNAGNSGAGGGQRRTIHIPIPRNLPPGHRYSIRVNLPPNLNQDGTNRVQFVNLGPVPQGGGVGQAPGAAGARPVFHVHQVPVQGAQGQGAGQGSAEVHPILQQLQQQQRERMEREEQLREIREREERGKNESKKRAEKLKEILGFEQPLQVVEFEVEERTAQLSWERKDVEVPEGMDEVEYSVLAYCDDKKDSRKVYSGTDCRCDVGSEILTLGHTHHFTVTARVGDIVGDPSQRASLVVPALPPSKPLPPKLSNRAKNALTFRWNAPQDNGSPITHYELEWDQCRGEWDQLISDKAKQYKFIHKFPPSSSAQFRVRANNSVGVSPFSDPLDFHAGAGPPSVPQPPTLEQAGVKHLDIHWTPPQSNGAEILSYTLEMKDPVSGYGYRPVYQGPDTSFTCTGLQRVTEYSFRLTATNEKGQSPASPCVVHRTLSNVPGCPLAPFIRDKPTPNSLTIAWQEPADNGGMSIQSYQLQMSNGGGSGDGEELVDVYAGPALSFTAEGLQPGKKYQARVCAISAAGCGQFSPVATLSTPAVRPSPPLYVYVAGKPTQTSIPIQWGYPLSDGGSPIISYMIEMCQDLCTNWSMVATVADPRTFDDASTPSSPQPPLSHMVTQLSPGQQYQFRVTCCNTVGNGPPSVECSGQTAPGQPDCPSEVESSEVSANSALLKWKVPDSHGCAVESYTLQWFAELKSDQVSSCSAMTNQTSLRNLSPATSYQARVKAQSVAGSSDWSLPVTFTTTPSVPAPPTFTKQVSSTPNSILVAWNVPHANGSPITAYHIEVGAESGNRESHVIKVDASETQHTIADLKPNTTYRYRVQAENAIGKGLFGSYGSGSTLPPPPPPPHLTLSSCSSHVLRVSWGKRPNRNLTYILHMAAAGNNFHEVFSGTAVSHRITRLQPDTEYTLKVAAVSASGQGDWSDHLTAFTAPTPPAAPLRVLLSLLSNGTLELKWQAVKFNHPLVYEAQYRMANVNQEYQQFYMGSDLAVPLTPSTHSSTSSVVYEARVRSCATCAVNGREEQVWSSYSSPALCRWEKAELPKVSAETAEKMEDQGKVGVVGDGKSTWTIGVLIFAVVTLFTIVVALILGQVAI